MIVQAIRSGIFYVSMFLVTAFFALLATILTPFPKAQFVWTKRFALAWARSMAFLLRWIVGIKTVVEGTENIPDGGAIVASKHQSDWDVVALYPQLNHPAFIAKKELFDIPWFGTAIRSIGTIEIDRSKGGAGVPRMIEHGKTTVEGGRKILIFSEGTRRAPFSRPHYRSGTIKLYEALDVPILPIALNSGLYWGRNSLILWPGTARARILKPIPPGLPPAEAQAAYTSAIESASIEMALEAVDQGLARPIDSEMRERIDAARKQVPSTTA